MYSILYKIEYYKLPNIDLDTNSQIFYGSTMNNNGITNYLKERYNEDFFKVISIHKDSKKVNYNELLDIYNNIKKFLTPLQLSKELKNLKIKEDYLLVEIIYEDESELFSKENFETEIMFYYKGKIGSELQKIIRKLLKKEILT